MRNIFRLDAYQVVTSDQNPHGVYSAVANFPKYYDSRNYERTDQNPDGSEELALIVAQADFADIVKQLSIAHNRAMWTVTLERADGRQIDRKTYGSFPYVAPTPEPEPEPEPEDEPEETA